MEVLDITPEVVGPVGEVFAGEVDDMLDDGPVLLIPGVDTGLVGVVVSGVDTRLEGLVVSRVDTGVDTGLVGVVVSGVDTRLDGLVVSGVDTGVDTGLVGLVLPGADSVVELSVEVVGLISALVIDVGEVTGTVGEVEIPGDVGPPPIRVPF